MVHRFNMWLQQLSNKNNIDMEPPAFTPKDKEEVLELMESFDPEDDEQKCHETFRKICAGFLFRCGIKDAKYKFASKVELAPNTIIRYIKFEDIHPYPKAEKLMIQEMKQIIEEDNDE